MASGCFTNAFKIKTCFAYSVREHYAATAKNLICLRARYGEDLKFGAIGLIDFDHGVGRSTANCVSRRSAIGCRYIICYLLHRCVVVAECQVIKRAILNLCHMDWR